MAAERARARSATPALKSPTGTGLGNVRPLIQYRMGVVAVLVGVGSYGLSLAYPALLFIAFAVQLVAVTLVVASWRGQPVLGGWDLVVVSAVAGAGLRSYYLATGRPSQAVIDFYFLRGQSSIDLVGDALLYALAIGLVGIGYWASFKSFFTRTRARTFLLRVTMSRPHRARIICLLIGVCSLGVLFLFAQATGGFDPANLSAKRAIRLHENESSGFENLLRMFSDVALPAAALHLGLRPRQRLGIWRSGNVLLFALALLPAVYASSRSDLVVTAVILLAVQRLVGVPTRRWLTVVMVLVVLGLFTFVSSVRSSPGSTYALVSPVSMETLDSLAINRNMLDYTRLANLRIALEYGWTDFQLGRNYLAPFLAPIPRALWPSKPLISPGLDFAREVYGSDSQGGIPPDGPTELYWNFGLAGMLVLAPLAGAVLGAMEAWMRRRSVGNAGWYFYLLGPFLVTYRWVTISLTHAVTLTLQTMVIAALVFALAGGKVRLVRAAAGPLAK